jgi:hypothetical protein
MKRDKYRPRSPRGSPHLPAQRRGRRGKGRDVRGPWDELSEAERLAEIGWVEWCGELIFAVGFTEGGAPFGLRRENFVRRTV